MMMASRVSRGSKLLAAVALMVGALSGVEASEDRPDSVMPQVTVKDIVEFTRLARPQERRKIDASPVFDVSPDGRHLLLVVRRGDVALNKNIFTLLHYRMDAIRGYLAGPENAVLPQPRQLLQWASSSLHVFEEAIRDLRWLPDSRRITFLGEENDAPTQVYEMDIESGHYTQLTRHPQPVLAYHYRPDSGKTIYVVRHNQTLKEWNPSSHIAGVNAVFQLLLPHDPTHFPLKFQFAVTDAAAAQQWRSIGDAFEADNVPILRVSPNARMAVSFEPITDIEEVQRWADQYPILMQGTAARALKMKEERSDYFARRYSGGLGRFALYDLSSGKRTFIDAPGGGFVAGHGGSIDAHWLSDTKVVLANIFIPRGAKLVGAIRRNERELPVVAEYDLESSAWRIIEHLYPAYLKLNFDKMLASTVLRDDAVLEVRTAQEVRAYKRGAQGWQRVTARSAASKASQALQFSIEQSLNSRPDVYVADPLTGRKKRLTNLNPRFDQLELASAQPFTWKDRHGQEFQSQIILPVGYLAGRRYPLFVQTYSFDPSEFVLDGAGGTTSAAAVRVMSARGMLVLMLPVLRDGTGGHDEFLGYRELLRDAVDALDAQGLIDPTRIGISGFSGMGNIVRDLITFSDVPIASATIADSWNSSLFGYLVYNFGFGVYGSVLANEAMMGAKPWGEDLQTWVERDPMLRTDRIDAALRIEHYGSYVPPHWDAYVLLRRQHKPVELVWFPPPTIHQLRRPDQRMDSLQGNVDWHSFWLKGEEDPDLSKKDQYERWREMREMRETARRSRGEQTSARLPSS